MALGCGLLVGLERERRKGQGPGREVAGLRSFAAAALCGALASVWAQPWTVAAGLLALALLVAAARLRQPATRDPGLTTELALLATFLIGALAQREALAAATAAVVLTALLAARSRLHHFALRVLREEELHDGLLLGALALLVLPLLPAAPLALLGGMSARQIGWLVLLLLAVQAASHVALRLLGARVGLLLSGLLGGLVSSTATVLSLAGLARQQPALAPALAAAAIFSTAATWAQTLLMLWPLAPALARTWTPVALAGLGTALLFGTCLHLWAQRKVAPLPAAGSRRPLRPREALLLAAVLTAVSLGVAFAQQQLGALGVLGGAALAGLADAHAALPALAGLASEGRIDAPLLTLALLLALGTNSLTRTAVAALNGGPRFGLWLGAALLAQWAAAGAMAWALRA